MNKLKLLLNAAAVLGLCALSGQCLAWCAITNPKTTNFTMPDIAIPSGAAVGTRLKTVTVTPLTSGNSIWSCSAWAPVYFYFRYGSARTAVTGSGLPAGVFTTNVDGIGVRAFGTPFVPVATNGASGAPSPLLGSGATNSELINLSGVTLEFYKTGEIGSGDLQFPGNFLEASMNTSSNSTSGGGGPYHTIRIANSPKIKTLGCETPNLTVDLGKHAKSDFSGVGSTSTPKTFNFAVNNCDRDMNAVKYTFNPASGITLEESGTANQHLSVKTGTGAATGIGVQVLYSNDTLVPFGTPTALNPPYNKLAGGDYKVAMKARYIQTAATISAGRADSALEFTMTYE